MPWKETSVMEQREQFIRAWQTGRYTKIALCRRFNISRPTGDKWLKRHFEEGLSGLADRPKTPKTQPNKTPIAVCELLIQAKHKRPHWGAKKLLNLLRTDYPELTFPANSTGDLILKRAGLVIPRKRKRRTPADTQPFGDCTDINQCWSVDFKGDFALGNKQRCYPLTVTDNYSRYLLLCQGVNSTSRQAVYPYFERLFKAFGLPWAIRSDNGSPFASRALGGLSLLSKWWIDLGIRHERIEPGKPQQNGRHERMHRSLKDYLKRLDKIEYDLQKQQQQFDEFRTEFNEFRSHESLGDRRPASLYRPSLRVYPTRIERYDYDAPAVLRKVKKLNGEGNAFTLAKSLQVSILLYSLMQTVCGKCIIAFICSDKCTTKKEKYNPQHSGTSRRECKLCARVTM